MSHTTLQKTLLTTLDALFESALLLDVNLYVIAANRSFYRRFNVPVSSVIGTHLTDLALPWNDLSLIQKLTRGMDINLHSVVKAAQSFFVNARYIAEDVILVTLMEADQAMSIDEESAITSHLTLNLSQDNHQPNSETSSYELLLSTTRRQAQHMALLYRAREVLTNSVDLPLIIREVVEAVADSYGYTLVSLYLLEHEDTLVLQHQVGYDTVVRNVPINTGISGGVVRTGKPVLIRDVNTVPEFIAAISGIRSEICVPLKVDGNTIGVLNVESHKNVELSEHDLALIIALADDISLAVGRARLFTEMREAREKYQSVVESIQEVIYQVDLNGAFIFINAPWHKLTGYEIAETLGRSVLDFVQPDDHAKIIADFEAIIAHKLSNYHQELRLRTKTGAIAWIETWGGPSYTDDGVLTGTTGILKDITTSKAIEEALRKSEERYTLAITAGQTVVWEWDTPTQSIFMSSNLRSILGYQESELDLSTQSILDIMPGEDFQHILRGYQTANARSETFYEQECRFRHKDGSYRWFMFRAQGTYNDTVLSYLVGTLTDITERKETEEQALQIRLEREKISLLQRFLRDASHDLRTPITTLHTSTYVLGKMAERIIDNINDLSSYLVQTPKVEQTISQLIQTSKSFVSHTVSLKESINRLQALVENMLDMVRLDNNEVKFKFSYQDLNVLIKKITDMQMPLITMKAITTVFIPTDNLPLIYVDQSEIERALQNLVENATQYTLIGGKITIHTYRDDEHVIIEISDTGIGISDTALPYIFDRFYRADEARATHNGGSGLGLSIVKKIVDAHQGTITVDSVLYHGTTFRILFPIIPR